MEGGQILCLGMDEGLFTIWKGSNSMLRNGRSFNYLEGYEILFSGMKEGIFIIWKGIKFSVRNGRRSVYYLEEIKFYAQEWTKVFLLFGRDQI